MGKGRGCERSEAARKGERSQWMGAWLGLMMGIAGRKIDGHEDRALTLGLSKRRHLA